MGEIKKLQLVNLDQGRAVARIDDLFAEVAKDIEERPHIKTARKIQLTIEVISDPTDDGAFNIPKIGWSCALALPKAKGTMCAAMLRDGELKVNVNDPAGDHPEQPTLFAQSGQVIGM